MITADGQIHTRYRRLVSKAFSPRSIAAFEPMVRTITTRLIDSWIDRARIEFVEDFAVPLPVEVIARALNVPEDRLEDFRRWSDATVLTFGATPTIDERIAAIHTVHELQRFFLAAIDDRRRQPQDDLLTSLLEARIDDDVDAELDDKRPLAENEIVSLVQELLVGGNETTTKLVAEMVRLLAGNPERWEEIRRDPEVIPAVVEESLRLASPAQAMWRLATADTELGGVPIPAGSRVVLSYASANRDEAVFADPDRFDVARDPNDHLAFGIGEHFCLGASLARMQLRCILREVATRLPDLALAGTASIQNGALIHGVKRMPVHFTPER
jgi:cytochrome P450